MAYDGSLTLGCITFWSRSDYLHLFRPREDGAYPQPRKSIDCGIALSQLVRVGLIVIGGHGQSEDVGVSVSGG